MLAVYVDAEELIRALLFLGPPLRCGRNVDHRSKATQRVFYGNAVTQSQSLPTGDLPGGTQNLYSEGCRHNFAQKRQSPCAAA